MKNCWVVTFGFYDGVYTEYYDTVLFRHKPSIDDILKAKFNDKTIKEYDWSFSEMLKEKREASFIHNYNDYFMWVYEQEIIENEIELKYSYDVYYGNAFMDSCDTMNEAEKLIEELMKATCFPKTEYRISVHWYE